MHHQDALGPFDRSLALMDFVEALTESYKYPHSVFLYRNGFSHLDLDNF